MTAHTRFDASIGEMPDGPVKDLMMASPYPEFWREYAPTAGVELFDTQVLEFLARAYGLTDLDRFLAAPTAGGKEFIATTPMYLGMVHYSDWRNVMLVPELHYHTVPRGARLGRLQMERVPSDRDGRMDLSRVPDDILKETRCIYVCSPGNPTGVIEDFATIAEVARKWNIFVISDECYGLFRYNGDTPDTMLNHLDERVLVLHSLSKSHSLAGIRCGFFAGDVQTVQQLLPERRESGAIGAAPMQHVVMNALRHPSAADENRKSTLFSLRGLQKMFVEQLGLECELPAGGLYLWVKVPEERFADGEACAKFLQEHLGLKVAPGRKFGPDGVNYIRVAGVVPHHRMGDFEEDLGFIQIN